MKTDNDIERILKERSTPALAPDEKASMKSVLLAHARKDVVRATAIAPHVSLWSLWYMRGALSLASLMVVFVGTAHASQTSLPGEPLYAMKVNVVEEIVAFTKWSSEEQVSYDIELMETRFGELKSLAIKNEIIEPETLTAVSEQINEHVADITSSLATEEEVPAVSHEEKIETFNKLVGIVKAQEKFTKGKKAFGLFSEELRETRSDAVDSLESAVEDFAEGHSTSSVSDYLSEQMTEMGEYAQATSTPSEVRGVAEKKLHDVEELLIEGNTPDALISILEVQQAFEVEEYLGDGKQSEEMHIPVSDSEQLE